MGFHFCADELFAILTILAGWKYVPGWVRGVWGRRHRDCSNPGHDHKDS
jgi:hypothetical protein